MIMVMMVLVGLMMEVILLNGCCRVLKESAIAEYFELMDFTSLFYTVAESLLVAVTVEN